MGRWEPNARGRLARAALMLSAERGYDATTVAEIAAAARVTERTFYRYFADKADAMFPDNTQLLVRLAAVVRSAVADGQDPMDAAVSAVRVLASYASEEPERALLSAQVIPAVPALLGRDLVRQRQMADALSGALVDSGVPPLNALLAAEGALSVWRVARDLWVHEPEASTLLDAVATTAQAARAQAQREPVTVPAASIDGDGPRSGAP